MNTSKLFISGISALAVVGAIGLANAQSTSTPAPGTPGAVPEANNATVRPTQDPSGANTGNTMNNSTMNNGTMSNSTTPGDTSNTELAAQADRN